MGPFKAGDISGHGKMQQLELCQPPPSLSSIPVEGGFGSRVKGEGWGMAWQRNEAQGSMAVPCHSWGVTQGKSPVWGTGRGTGAILIRAGSAP